MRNNTKLFNSITKEKFEILENIYTGIKSVPFKPRSNGIIQFFKLKFKSQYIIESNTYFENDKNEWNIIEYTKFGNLREFQKNLLKKEILSESILCFIAYQILNALKYIHKRKIVHLDLKPENIIIDEHLNVKLINFSKSLDYNKNKLIKIKLPFVGADCYTSPEILFHKTIDLKDLNKIDLYSLGVILFNLAYNSYPYGLKEKDGGINKDFSKTLKKIEIENLDVNIEDGNYFSSYFKDFLKRLLEKNINKRINIIEALEHYWIKGAQILNDEKENLDDSKKFLDNLINNSLINFNHYINN